MPYANREKQKEYMKIYQREYRKAERKLIRAMRKLGFSTAIGGVSIEQV